MLMDELTDEDALPDPNFLYLLRSLGSRLLEHWVLWMNHRHHKKHLCTQKWHCVIQPFLDEIRTATLPLWCNYSGNVPKKHHTVADLLAKPFSYFALVLLPAWPVSKIVMHENMPPRLDLYISKVQYEGCWCPRYARTYFLCKCMATKILFSKIYCFRLFLICSIAELYTCIKFFFPKAFTILYRGFWVCLHYRPEHFLKTAICFNCLPANQQIYFCNI